MHLIGAGGRIISNITNRRLKYLCLDLTVSPDLADKTLNRDLISLDPLIPEDGTHHNAFLHSPAFKRNFTHSYKSLFITDRHSNKI